MRRLTRKGYALLALPGLIWMAAWYNGLGLGTSAMIVMLSTASGWALHKESKAANP